MFIYRTNWYSEKNYFSSLFLASKSRKNEKVVKTKSPFLFFGAKNRPYISPFLFFCAKNRPFISPFLFFGAKNRPENLITRWPERGAVANYL